MSSRLPVYFVLAFLAVGCSSPPADDAESSNDAITVKPSGTGDLGTVTVHLPPGYVATVPSLSARFVFKFNGTEITPEAPTRVLPAQNSGSWGCLEVLLVKGSGVLARSNECTYQLRAGETKTINLSLLKAWWSAYPNVWASMVTSDAQGTAHVARLYGSNVYRQWEAAGYALYGRNDIALPVVPGTYQYAIEGSPLPPFVIDVPEGQQVDANVGYDAFLATLDVAFPDPEGMPDSSPSASTIAVSCPGAKRTFTSPAKALPVTILLGRNDLATACSYTANGFTTAFSLKPQAHVSAPLKRLNIDDVTLTDEAGAKVPGSFQVRRWDDVANDWGQWAVDGRTHTGIDVPSGKYQILVTYSPHGQSRQQWLEVNL